MVDTIEPGGFVSIGNPNDVDETSEGFDGFTAVGYGVVEWLHTGLRGTGDPVSRFRLNSVQLTDSGQSVPSDVRLSTSSSGRFFSVSAKKAMKSGNGGGQGSVKSQDPQASSLKAIKCPTELLTPSI